MSSNVQLSRLFLEIFGPRVAHSNGPVFCRSNEQLWAQKSQEIAEKIKNGENQFWTLKNDCSVFPSNFFISRDFLAHSGSECILE